MAKKGMGVRGMGLQGLWQGPGRDMVAQGYPGSTGRWPLPSGYLGLQPGVTHWAFGPWE